MKTVLSLLTATCLSAFIVGCASTKEDVFAGTEQKTMEEIHDETFGLGLKLESLNEDRRIENDKYDQSGFTRTASTELEELFPELPNPKLSMYVYPHITRSNLPVPGYTTVFYMYKNIHFALPGELRD